jgi:7,8-dihydropterin-6-yl-methyl-4-(beta-D-ribofuranosyl)aminobenzene 5'-phosphate synthase
LTTVTVLYDNAVHSDDPGLVPDWGLSCLVETGRDAVLFDAGQDGRILLENVRILSKDLSSLSAIVISHEHSDHFGGLKVLSERIDLPMIYRLKRDRRLPGSIQTVVGSPMEIVAGVRTIGPVKVGAVPEQSLVIDGKDAPIVLTGCSHPGIEAILGSAFRGISPTGIIGGFHDLKDLDPLRGLKLICPLHCTRDKKRILASFPGSAIPGGVGKVFEL